MAKWQGIMASGAAALFASAVVAQALTAVPSGTYGVDTSRSRVTAKVPYFGVSSMSVIFPQVAGNLVYDSRTPQAIQLDVNVDATSLDGGSSFNNGKLKGEDFFNTKVYPTIYFRGNSLTMTGARTANVSGNMIVRGITKPATLNVTFNSALADISRTGRVSMTAKTKIKRSDFGMTAWGTVVGETVSLTINVEMAKR